MATLNIKDPTVREMAMRLAMRRSTTMTDAIRQALVEALARPADDYEKRLEVLRRISAESVAITEPISATDALYDSAGLPR